jgi:adenylylsulfate kinase-like enzyme
MQSRICEPFLRGIDNRVHTSYHTQMNEKNHIQVIVAGFAGVGKTTVGDIIHKALLSEGFTNITFVDEGSAVITEERRKLCVASLIEDKTSIGIQTRQMTKP